MDYRLTSCREMKVEEEAEELEKKIKLGKRRGRMCRVLFHPTFPVMHQSKLASSSFWLVVVFLSPSFPTFQGLPSLSPSFRILVSTHTSHHTKRPPLEQYRSPPPPPPSHHCGCVPRYWQRRKVEEGANDLFLCVCGGESHRHSVRLLQR